MRQVRQVGGRAASVERVAAERDFFAIGIAIAVRIGHIRLGAARKLFGVGQPIAIPLLWGTIVVVGRAGDAMRGNCWLGLGWFTNDANLNKLDDTSAGQGRAWYGGVRCCSARLPVLRRWRRQSPYCGGTMPSSAATRSMTTNTWICRLRRMINPPFGCRLAGSEPVKRTSPIPLLWGDNLPRGAA